MQFPNLKQQPISIDVLRDKYLKEGESTAADVFARVARVVAQAESEAQREQTESGFLWMMRNGGIGAGRIMSGGASAKTTMINCFVQPVADLLYGFADDGLPGIFSALSMAAETMRRGGGVGYYFGLLRPYGARVKGTNSIASGPCSYINVFDAACATVASEGSRRGAQMAVLDVSHPDIEQFVDAKTKPGVWTNFNVSVMVDYNFMQFVFADEHWELVHAAEPHNTDAPGVYRRDDGLWVYRVVSARELWKKILRNAYDNGEPGILFKDLINLDNNLHYCEDLLATNPCGEQPLPNYGCCDLGPIILPRFVTNPFTEQASLDTDRLKAVVQTMVRFLDNVLDVTQWPLPEQQAEAQAKRRIGVGFTGLGNALAMLGLDYGSEKARRKAAQVTELIRNTAYETSVELAMEKGAFPLFDADKYLFGSTSASRLPPDLKEKIRKHGIRNSHLLSIAPTGTVSLAFADNASNGIEPPFDLCYTRKVRQPDGSHKEYRVLDHSLRVLCAIKCIDPESEPRETLMELARANHIVTAQELTVDQHLLMVAAVQPHVDASISKTINVPEDYPFDDFCQMYEKAYELGLKGVAAYRPNPNRGSVLIADSKPVGDGSAPKAPMPPTVPEPIDERDARIVKRPLGDLESITSKVSYSGSHGDATMYVSVSFIRTNSGAQRPLEVFIQAAPEGVPMEWVAAFARNLSLLARSGLSLLSRALSDSRAVRCDTGRVRHGWYVKDDGTKVPRFHESVVAMIGFAVQEILCKRGILDSEGMPSATPLTVPAVEALPVKHGAPVAASKRQPSKACPECGAHAVIRKDGCDFCTSCGAIGSCG